MAIPSVSEEVSEDKDVDPNADASKLAARQTEQDEATRRQQTDADAIRQRELLAQNGADDPSIADGLQNAQSSMNELFSKFADMDFGSGSPFDVMAAFFSVFGVDPVKLEELREEVEGKDFSVIGGNGDVEATDVAGADTNANEVEGEDAQNNADGENPEEKLEVAEETSNVTNDDVELNASGTEGVNIDDKGYVQNDSGAPVTFNVDIPSNGEPVRQEEGALFGFKDGGNLADGFSFSSDPDVTAITMVDPSKMPAFDNFGNTDPEVTNNAFTIT